MCTMEYLHKIGDYIISYITVGDDLIGDYIISYISVGDDFIS